MSRLVLSLFLFTASLFASASHLYVAQNATGTGNGGSCSNAFAVSFFNNPANWGSTSLQIGAGTTVHLCGTFTGVGGATELIFQGSGTSVNPVTLFFESGAVLSSPWWSSSGAINTNGQTWLVIDGGTNGIIQNTANGSNLANHQTSRAVTAANCNNCAVKNLTVSNIYVHVGDDTSVDQTNMNCIMAWPVNNFIADHNTCHDMGWALNIHGSNVTLSNNNVYNIDHGVAFGPSSTTSGLYIFGNHFHDYANWDTSTNRYHHDGIHLWGGQGCTNCAVTNGYIYNNLFDGDPGVNDTAHVFLEQDVRKVIVFNNVFSNPLNNPHMNCIWALGKGASPVGNAVYNNFIEAGAIPGDVVAIDYEDELGLSVINNISMGGNVLIYLDAQTTLASGGLDYNAYQDLATDGGSYNTFGWHGTNYTTLSWWQSQSGGDVHAVFGTSSVLKMNTSTGEPNTGSPIIGAGKNLTDLCNADPNLAPLCRDKNGVQRSATGAWDAGAYQFSGIAPPPPSTYTLTVMSGSGDGSYLAGTVVTTTADAPPAGQVFLNWTGATVANPASPTTTLVMPAANAAVTANYTSGPPPPPPTTYTLTVVSGSGDGSYLAGTVVTTTANAPPTGQAFLNWTGATVANPASPTTTLVMPAANATATANYTSSPPPPAVHPTCSVSFIGRSTVIGPNGVRMLVAPSRTSISGKITWTATGTVCP